MSLVDFNNVTQEHLIAVKHYALTKIGGGVQNHIKRNEVFASKIVCEARATNVHKKNRCKLGHIVICICLFLAGLRMDVKFLS